MKPARLIEGYHTLTHYYNIEDLNTQITDIQSRYNEIFTDVIRTQQSYRTKTDLLTTTINHTLAIINKKLMNLRLHSPKPQRTKRGLVNGLGSLIKFVTGNLDAEDEIKYNNIINHLQRNQETIQSQIEAQYSINQIFAENFNKTMQVVNHNNEQLQREFESLKSALTGEQTHIRATNDLLEHYQFSLNILLDVIQDIETSLVFCELGKLHPTILDPDSLHVELNRLQKFYGPRILEHSSKDLFELQYHIKVRCVMGIDELIYFLDIPLVKETKFDLYSLQSLPTKTDDGYLTVLPSTHLFLISKDLTLPLRGPCPSSTSYSLCPGHLISDLPSDCESTFLGNKSTQHCNYTKLIIPRNYATLLPDVNQYLLVFPFGDLITLTTPNGMETHSLQGIYLIKPDGSEVTYQNRTLFLPHHVSHGTPFIFNSLRTDHLPPTYHSPQNELTLQNLGLPSVLQNPITPIRRFTASQLVTPSIWTSLLYVLLVALVFYTIRNYLKYRRSLDIHPEPNRPFA